MLKQTLKAIWWKYDKEKEKQYNEAIIYLGGLDPENKSVMVEINNFTPFLYVELPRLRGGKIWTKNMCKQFISELYTIRKNNLRIVDKKNPHYPKAYNLQTRRMLRHNREVQCLMIAFKTTIGCRKFRYKMNGKIEVPGVQTFLPKSFKVHEYKIDPIILLASALNIDLAEWLEIEYNPEIQSPFSKCDIDITCEWGDISQATLPELKNVISKPKYISFDGEMYSSNHNSKIPNPKDRNNEIFHISNAVGRLNEDVRLSKYSLFTLFDPLEIKDMNLYGDVNSDNIKILRYESESALILGWCDYVSEENPDIFIGYNIMKFDWQYIVTRSSILGILNKVLKKLGRFLYKPAQVEKFKWKSSAYGTQEFECIDCHNVQVDVLIEVERNYKLATYSLNAVSEKFLKEKKEDVRPVELFMLYQIAKKYDYMIKNDSAEISLSSFKNEMDDILKKRKIHAMVKDYKDEVMACKKDDIIPLVRKALWITGVYAIKDVVLPVRLVNKLQLWVSMEAMSNCMKVPMSYLHTRGQGIRVLAQIYRETFNNNMIITNIEDEKETQNFQGATVITAIPGFHEFVATLDFASLYPSMMIAYNICYTTIVNDIIVDGTWGHDEKDWFIPDKKVKDEECHVFDYWDHKNCEHDPNGKKGKNDKVLCFHHRYRFKKMKVLADGTRVGEGLLPRLERSLLAERKSIKKEMAMLDAKLKMQRGLADNSELEMYKKYNYEIIEKGSMSQVQEEILAVAVSVLNARQLAVKVSCNSMYGALGAPDGDVPLIKAAASITAMGRFSLKKVVEYLGEHWVHAKVVYGDTDSVMVIFQGRNTSEAFRDAEKAGDDISAYLRCKLNEMDMHKKYNINGTYKKIWNIKESDLKYLDDQDRVEYYKYIYTPITLEFEHMYGKFFQLTKKRYLAEIINKKGEVVGMNKKGVVTVRRDNCSFLKKTYEALINIIMDKTKKYKDAMNFIYDRINELFTRQIPIKEFIIYMGISKIIEYAKHKKGANDTKIFLDEQNRIIEPNSPLDRRLVYPNLPQVILTLKMMRRGEDVPANTRLEYLFVDVPKAEHQGDKAEDYTYFRDNRIYENLKIDYFHYFEKQFIKPVSEAIAVRYPQEQIPFFTPEERFDLMYKKHVNKYTNFTPKKKINVVKQIITDRTGFNSELVDSALTYYSDVLISKMHRTRGIRRIHRHKPTGSVGTTKKETEVWHIPTQTIYKIKSSYTRDKTVFSVKKKENKETVYILVDDKENEIHTTKEDIALMYRRDSFSFEYMLKYRLAYKSVVSQLKEIFQTFIIKNH